jgi:hypothetical protein
MQKIFEILSDIDFWKIIAPIALAIVAWLLNERSKRKWKEYKRKEKRYSALLHTLKGFYVNSHDKALKDEFLYQLNLCWLYAPDEVIKLAYAFLDKVKVGVKFTDTEKEEAAGELISAIRHDLLSRRLVKDTRLKAKDYRHLRAK